MRKALKVRTAFNLLGPMLNPADAAYGLVGVYSTAVSHLMADALQVGWGMEWGAAGVGWEARKPLRASCSRCTVPHMPPRACPAFGACRACHARTPRQPFAPRRHRRPLRACSGWE